VIDDGISVSDRFDVIGRILIRIGRAGWRIHAMTFSGGVEVPYCGSED
jgi:hypothetical protein